MVRMNRRHFLHHALTLSAALSLRSGWASAGQTAAPRWIVMNWGFTEMALSLGIVPVGVSAPAWYRRLYAAPALPAQVTDVGLLYQPNFETLRDLHPTLMIITPAHGMARAQLATISPLLTLDNNSKTPLVQAMKNLQQMAAALGQPERSQRLIDQANARFEQLSQTVAPYKDTAVYLVHAVDVLHVALFSHGSLFDAVLQRLGLNNACTMKGGPEGAVLTTLDKLATAKPGTVVLLPSYPQVDDREVLNSRLWQSLGMLHASNIVHMPTGLDPSGGVQTAVRFAEFLVKGLVKLAKETRR